VTNNRVVSRVELHHNPFPHPLHAIRLANDNALPAVLYVLDAIADLEVRAHRSAPILIMLVTIIASVAPAISKPTASATKVTADRTTQLLLAAAAGSTRNTKMKAATATANYPEGRTAS
jgi:hypothetical protein